MKPLFKTFGRVALAFGLDPRKVLRAVVAWPTFLKDVLVYKKKHKASSEGRFPLRVKALYPILTEKSEQAGSMGAYFHQDLYVARRIFDRKPSMHMDIGSRVDGFVGHLLIFMNVTIVDVRPMDGIDGLACILADGRNLKSCINDASVPSLSCLHALEHFGLGRYGDDIDPDAWCIGLQEMYRILQPEGIIYLSVPVGKERLEFNAHRIFSPLTILRYANHIGFTMKSSTHINNEGVMQAGISEKDLHGEGRSYSKGSVMIYEFTK